MHVSECRSCGASMIWARTPNGKNVPLDSEPNSAGQWVLEDEDAPKPDAKRLSDAEAASYTGPKYQSHFETCPQAKQWSRGGKNGNRKGSGPRKG